ncbi:hypothetical protein, partial [Dyella silvae]|uniref:hypothetical protein n=1 Tax=Dyella silvae TaxID=2994424 RepID=UPI002263DF3E
PAHTVKDLNHLLTVSVSALEHFVPSEPLILHHLSSPSTPSAKYFFVSGFSLEPVEEELLVGTGAK